MTIIQFEPFQKIARLSRDIVVSEKIDGTNAQVAIEPMIAETPMKLAVGEVCYDRITYAVFAGSRTRWLSPGKQTDNFGFAGWVAIHAQELVVGLGPGRHYGEWWGVGIQRGYGLYERRFSLFNVKRFEFEWPACCHVVPVLYRGPFSTAAIDSVLTNLDACGSVAAPGFFPAEGVVAYHAASGTLFKKTILNDDKPKSEAA